MDSASKKSFELQAQVRQNAEVFKNTLNDLYNWERDMKDKELKIKDSPPETPEDKPELKTLPVRSHALKEENKEQQKPIAKATDLDGKSRDQLKGAITAEKSEYPLDPNEEKRKRANQFKVRGNNAVKIAKYLEAIDEYTRAIETFPEDAVFYSNRALCQLKLERYIECILDCERAIEIDNLAIKAYYRRMQANESLGNYLDALNDCTSVLMMDPKNMDAKKSLERINSTMKKAERNGDEPNFSELCENMIDILPVDKPPYKRSSMPLRRVPVVDIVGPKDGKDVNNVHLQISDEDIDKLFNSNIGPFVEVKSGSNNTAATSKAQSATSAGGKKAGVDALKVQSKRPAVASGKGEAIAGAGVDALKVQSKPPEVASDKGEAIAGAVGKVEEATSLPVANEAASCAGAKDARLLPSAPTTTSQFYSNWKELSSEQKYQYLKSIDLRHLSRILGAGFDSATLTEVLFVLRDHYLPNKEPTTASTLLEVSKNSQIFIMSMLLSAEERNVLKEIVAEIERSGNSGATSTIVKSIRKNFEL